MKNKRSILAGILGAIAAAALVLSLRSPVNVDTLIGYGSVLALLGFALMEYRISWKRLLGR
jgi:hypothetical protein